MEAVLNLKMSPTLQTRCEKLEEKNKVLILTAFNDGCVQTPFHLKETHIFCGGQWLTYSLGHQKFQHEIQD